MLKSLYFLCIFSVLISCKNNKNSSSNELQWLSIEEANKIADKGTDKKFIIDVYTDWCHWCKVMDKKTFSDPEVIAFLNEKFHMVKFDAEQKDGVRHKGQEFKWEAMGRNGVNMLAVELLKGQLSYPSLVYLNSNLESIMVSPGYKDSQRLVDELKALR